LIVRKKLGEEGARMLFYLSLIEGEQDKRKFERIYEAYRQIMFYAANRILRDRHLAEDAVHLAFMRVIDHLEKINEEDGHKTRGFLVTVTENISIDLYRKRKKENLLSYDEMGVYIAETQGVYNEENEIVAAMMRLPVQYSAVFKLKYVQGFENGEIAAILNLNEAAVRKRLSRGKEKLSQLLNEGEKEVHLV